MSSPNGSIRLVIQIPRPGSSKSPQWSVSFRGKPILEDSHLSLKIAGEGDLLVGNRILDKRPAAVNNRLRVLFGKTEYARNNYRETRFALENRRHRRTDVVFRCYNDAVAVRYEIPKQQGLNRLSVTDEGTSFALSGNPLSYVQYLENYRTSHEHHVAAVPLRSVKPNVLLDMPTIFAWADGAHIAITEAALRRYAGMSLMRPMDSENKTELVCRLTPRPDGTKVIRDLPLITPWRVVIIGDRPGDFLESNTLYCLNEPSAIKDISWIKPGKLTFSWWNGNVVKNGKDSPPIFSMDSQKTYIDFCAANGIEFHSVIADNSTTPWYKQSNKGIEPGPDTDVTQIRSDLDLAGILRYAKSKGIRLWTWVHQGALRGRVEEAFAAFERIGWSGMMVDFFDHDDQETVEFAEEILQAAARHHILIHYHGIWKPTGMQRTYPNLMNHEGALNLEYLKWNAQCTPEHTLNLLFTRMVAGPMDYHLGGFRAVSRAKFKPHFIAPTVLGTRCHMLASYVCLDNPTPMVADYPEAYEGQPGFEFLRSVPTWWDETRVLVGRIGEIIVTARRKGRTWYLGGMGAKRARDMVIPLSFLGSEKYTAKFWKDATETNTDPNRLVTGSFQATTRYMLRMRVAKDGGFVAMFSPTKYTLRRGTK
jgi:alpha-glucosidase